MYAGAYANIYESGETATFLNAGGSQTVIFTAGGDGTYTATIDAISTGITYSEGNTYFLAGLNWTMGSVYTEGVSNSNICFAEGTLILTTKGFKRIEKITNDDEIRFGNFTFPVHCSIKSMNLTGHMVLFTEKSLTPQIPFMKTYVSCNHKVYCDGKWKPAIEFVNKKTIKLIKTGNIPVYNILAKDHYSMIANGMIVETLDPQNGMAQSYIFD